MAMVSGMRMTQEHWGNFLFNNPSLQLPAHQGLMIFEADKALCSESKHYLHSEEKLLVDVIKRLFNKALHPLGKTLDTLSTSGQMKYTVSPDCTAYMIEADTPIKITIRPRDLRISLSDLYQQMLESKIANKFTVEPGQRLFVTDMRIDAFLKAQSKEEKVSLLNEILCRKLPNQYLGIFECPGDLTMTSFSENEKEGVIFTGSLGITIALNRL